MARRYKCIACATVLDGKPRLLCASCEHSYDRATDRDNSIAAIIIWAAKRSRRALCARMRWFEARDGLAAERERRAKVDREALGRVVREVWIAWAKEQPAPKPSWLVPWEDLSESDREVDRRIGEAIYLIAVANTTEWCAKMCEDVVREHGDYRRIIERCVQRIRKGPAA